MLERPTTGVFVTTVQYHYRNLNTSLKMFSRCVLFRDCGFHLNFCTEFAFELLQFRQIESLSFSLLDRTNCCKEMDTNLVELMIQMPPWIQWVTFNSCFQDVKSALDTLCECLRARSASQKGLTGLAIINNGLHISNIGPLIEFLEKSNEPQSESIADRSESIASKTNRSNSDSPKINRSKSDASKNDSKKKIYASASKPKGSPQRFFRGLKWLDLSGNSLGDRGIAKVPID